MRIVLALAFLLSGAAGLWYESVWARYLGLFLGHAAYAQVIVLVIFLGGMALGAWLTGRISSRIARPLMAYALVEGVIGLLGFLFHPVYLGITDWAYASVFPALGGGLSLALARWGLAALLILPQSVLLGATFPLIAAGALRRIPAEPGRTLAVLYFANSLGAAVGVLIAGFYLLGAAGLPGVVTAASILNFIAAFVAVAAEAAGGAGGAGAAEAIARRRTTTPALSALSAPSAAPAPPAASTLLALAFATAATSFFYEIAWTRMLSLVLSSATHAFELMLSAFILGLAMGAYWIRSRADRLPDPIRTLGTVQWLMGLFALATLPLYLDSFHWTATLLQTVARTDPGYTGFTLARYGLALLVIFPATFCAGITLPLLMQILMQRGMGERAIGQVYAANTLGAIAGVAIAGLVLMPVVGLKWVIVGGALIDMALGVALLMRGGPSTTRSRRLAAGALAGWAIAALVAAFGPAFDPNLLVSGVYRYGVIPAPGSREILYYADGRTASVSAVRIKATGERFIATNGKSDGALPSYWSTPCGGNAPLQPLRSDAATVSLSPLIALAHRSDARVAAVIGQGTGMSTHLLLGSRAITDLYTIEIEPEMVRASRTFYPVNGRAFDDSRSHYVLDDAKSYFAAAGRQYDLIFSEPSEPWVSGVAGLFSEEFYRQVLRYLSPQGVFAQWIHLYDLDDRLVLTVLTAIDRTFRDYEIFLPTPTDILIVATGAAALPAPDWGVVRLPDIARDLCHQLPLTPEALEATRLGSRTSLGPMVAGSPLVNSDYHPRLDLGAERTRFLGRSATGLFGLSAERFDITAPFTGRRVAPVSFTQSPVADVPRLASLALGASLRDPATFLSADSMVGDDHRQTALFRERSWRALLASPEPPSNWRLWLRRMAEAEANRYGGTSGYADPAFYDQIGQYLARHAAPMEVRSAVEFRQALSGWEFPRAVRAAEPLIAATRAGRAWIPPDELRDGATVAHLVSGNVSGARRVFAWLAPFSQRGPADFRSTLLLSYLDSWRGK